MTGGSPPRAAVRSGTRVRLFLALLAVAVVLAVALHDDVRRAEHVGLVALAELGRFAPLLLIGLYCLGSALFLPVFWLDLAAGAHFGFLQGVLWVHTAACTASIVGFFLGRHLFSGFIERHAQPGTRLAALQDAVTSDGWRLVFLTRLSPIFSFSLLNVFYGATRIRFSKYFLASALGMFPGTVLYVYAGDMAGDLSGAPGHPDKPDVQWTFEALGFVATILVVIYVTQRAQRALKGRLGAGDAGAGSRDRSHATPSSSSAVQR